MRNKLYELIRGFLKEAPKHNFSMRPQVLEMLEVLQKHLPDLRRLNLKDANNHLLKIDQMMGELGVGQQHHTSDKLTTLQAGFAEYKKLVEAKIKELEKQK